MATNTNLTHTTRDLWIKTVGSQVLTKLVLWNRLLKAKQVKQVAGEYIRKTMDTANAESMAQNFDPDSDTLDSTRKTVLKTVRFNWKDTQLPIVLSQTEKLLNTGSDSAVIDFAAFYVKKAQEGMRRHMMFDGYGKDGVGTNTGKAFQSVRQALSHDVTYGFDETGTGITRGTTVTNAWWQGASVAGTYADQATAYGCSIDTIRKSIDAMDTYVPDSASVNGRVFITGVANYRTLKAWAEARNMRTADGDMVKYGFTSFSIDGVEIVKDVILQTAFITGSQTWLFGIDPSTWEYRIHPERSFLLTDMTWQGDQDHGRDQWSARIMLKGNLVCWCPNRNIYLSNIS